MTDGMVENWWKKIDLIALSHLDSRNYPTHWHGLSDAAESSCTKVANQTLHVHLLPEGGTHKSWSQSRQRKDRRTFCNLLRWVRAGEGENLLMLLCASREREERRRWQLLLPQVEPRSNLNVLEARKALQGLWNVLQCDLRVHRRGIFSLTDRWLELLPWEDVLGCDWRRCRPFVATLTNGRCKIWRVIQLKFEFMRKLADGLFPRKKKNRILEFLKTNSFYRKWGRFFSKMMYE